MSRQTSSVKRDPVCGREVHPEDADSWVEYGGTQYFFCCPECRRTFEEKPEQYKDERQTAQPHGERESL